MSGLLAVLPVITPDYALPCLDSLLRPDSAAGLTLDEILVVDNSRDGTLGHVSHGLGFTVHRDPSGHNLGVARSWNLGVQRVLDSDFDYLVILSASLLFGPILHTRWRRQMNEFWGARVIEAEGLSWKLIALHRTVFERIGSFDPAFWPGYWEATDLCRRLHLIGWEQGFVHVWCNAMAQTVGFHSDLVKPEPLLRHWEEKWGGPQGAEVWVMPYRNRPLDYVVEEPIPVLAQRYGYGERGTDWW